MGREITDEYGWLRERTDPDVKAYLEAENAYTDAVMKPVLGLQQALYDEMLGRIKETDLSVPERYGDYYYYARTTKGRQYRCYCRKRGSLEGPEEILLDVNELARGHDYLDLGVLKISPDHNLLAYSVDLEGDEKYKLQFKDLRTGERLDVEIPDTYDAVEWAADGRTLFYSTVDAAHRPYRLHRYVLGDDPADAELVFQEDDEAFYLGLYKTNSKRYLMLQLESNTTSEVRYLAADTPRGTFAVLQPRKPEVEYSVEHHGDDFYILTNEGARDFKLMAVPVADPAQDGWRTVLPHRDGTKLEDVEAFAGHLVLTERENGVCGARVVSLPGLEQHRIELPDPIYTLCLGGNPEFDTEELRFSYTSLVTPDSVFDYNMATRERKLRKVREVPGGYDREAYVSDRITATAADGVEVPISLVHRKGLERDGGSPLLLSGYGSYGVSSDPMFDSSRLSLLDRGFVFAIAHVRGGGELGRAWYDAGKLRAKRNTFTDFIACAEHLIAAGYSSRERLAIRGGSAGGMLIGAVINMRPDLFGAAVAKVPFVDVVNTLLDPSLPLTVTEWEEWGDPREAEAFEYIRSYSPYDNVAAAEYPDLLITAGLNDPRVAYWEAAKWAAKLRATKTGDGMLLLKTSMDAGHGGATGRYDRLRELAFDFAFILNRLGVK